MGPRPGESEEEYKARKRAERDKRKAEEAAAAAAGGGGESGTMDPDEEKDRKKYREHPRKDETEDEYVARKAEERRKRRKERDSKPEEAEQLTEKHRSSTHDAPAAMDPDEEKDRKKYREHPRKDETEDEYVARKAEERRKRRKDRGGGGGDDQQEQQQQPAAEKMTSESKHKSSENAPAASGSGAEMDPEEEKDRKKYREHPRKDETEDEYVARKAAERRKRRREKEGGGGGDDDQQDKKESRSKPEPSAAAAEDPDPEHERRLRREKREKEKREKEKAEQQKSNKPATPQTVRERLEARAKQKGDAAGGSSSPAKDHQQDYGDDDGGQYYEDDFEDIYDADEMSAVQRAMAAENAAVKAAKQKAAAVPASAAIVEMEGVARAGFDRKSLEEQKAKAQFDKDFQRASALRRVVDLEEVKFTVADIAPLSQYDMFIRGVGGVATNTVGENMPERSSIEIQAERVVMKSKGCSVPVDLGLDPETTTTVSSGDGKKGDSETAIAALARRSVDTASLSKFLNRAGSVVLSLLDEENDMKEGAAGAAGSNKQGGASLISFASLTSSFQASFCANRPITRVNVSPSTSQYFLAVHSAGDPKQQQQHNSSVYPGLVTIWNVHSHQQADKVLVAFSEIRDACFSRTRPYLIFGGTASGGVCVWDLREPASAHGGHGVGSIAFRLPSFTTDSSSALNHSAPVQRVVSCGSGGGGSHSGGPGSPSSTHSSSSSGDAGSVEQITSVDRTGCMSFWVLNESEEPSVISAIAATDGSSSKSSGNNKSSTAQQKGEGIAALEALVTASMSTASRVRLHRMGTGNTLDNNRGMKNSATFSKSAAGNFVDNDSSSSSSGGGGKKESSGVVATITDMEQSPIDATRLVVSAYTGVAHVSRFGSIAAPVSYGPTRMASGPGVVANGAVIGAGMTAASTCVASCRSDSRLLLVGYADGTIRLYLRVDTAPKLTVLATEHQSIVSVCFAPNTKWLAFALDGAGNIFALDFAIPGNRNKPFAQSKLVKTGNSNHDPATSLTTFVDERPETRLLVGFKSGSSEIYTFNDSALAPSGKRDMYWL